MEDTTQEHWIFLEGTADHREPTLEQIYPKELQPGEGPALWNCYGLTAIPHLLCVGRIGGGKGAGNEGVKLNLGKGEGSRRCCFKSFYFCFSLHKLF